MMRSTINTPAATLQIYSPPAPSRSSPRLEELDTKLVAVAMFAGFPFLLLTLHATFPWIWVWLFVTCFCLFFNTGPTNTISANVTHPSMRATAFALNILVIHALGGAPSHLSSSDC